MSTASSPSVGNAARPGTAAPSQPGAGRLKAVVRLLRPANLVTAAANILTGAVVVAAPERPLPWLVGASVCLYAGGVVLNDFFDRELDAVERPERPIPSGLVPAPAAAALGALLLLAGVVLAFGASLTSGLIAIALAASILAYDAFAKPRAAGPFVMGSCRALNLLLGLSAVPALLPHTWFLVFLPLLYILAITALSRGEVHGGTVRTSQRSALLVVAVFVGLAVLQGTSALRWERFLPFALLLAARVGPPLWRACRDPRPQVLRGAVHAGIVSLVVLDAALAAGYGGVILAAAILSLTIIAGELGRLFPIT